MRDSHVVAFEIPRPWPRHQRLSSLRKRSGGRWSFRGSFWTVAGLHLYWPPLITIWHVEPGGRDSGEVCKHYRRERTAGGTWETTILRGWRFHVQHWRVQVHPLQALRHWALTRCAWCHGPSRKGNPVNVSHQWDAPTGRWWRGEPGLYHRHCSSVANAHSVCLCAESLLNDGASYGQCLRCGRFHRHGGWSEKERTARRLLVAGCPAGQAPTADLLATVAPIWAAIRAERDSADTPVP